MDRIENKFKDLRKRKKKAFIVYITAGYPSLEKTKRIVLELEKIGVDIVELGVPFSDPMADGLTIQRASEKSLERGTTLRKILASVKSIRAAGSNIPIVLMSYLNPVYHYGIDRFIRDASKDGVDGLICPDLPPDEADEIIRATKGKDFSVVFLAASTSTLERLKIITSKSKGFIYYVSLTGVTGARKKLPADIAKNIRKIKALTSKPVCVGFGISSAKLKDAVGRDADGVIVGSAVVDYIIKNEKSIGLEKSLGRFIKKRFNL